jgi:hypothetical protein
MILDLLVAQRQLGRFALETLKSRRRKVDRLAQLLPGLMAVFKIVNTIM